MSGHSKWSTIKHKKGAADAKRGKLFTKIARMIAVAAREGGSDIETNFALRLAVDRAKGANMPKDNIERAIERGAGGGKGEDLQRVLYEGYGPNGTAILVSALTDNRNRTVGEVRFVFSKFNGSLGEAGSVAWQFDQRGILVFENLEKDPDEVALLAIDAGALDVETDNDAVTVYTEVADFQRVKEALAQAGLDTDNADLGMVPSVEVEVSPKETMQVMRLLEGLEDLDDIEQVWSNLSIDDEAAQEFAAA
jgi:YebC/PmpR family DNA-binding regulatory protein